MRGGCKVVQLGQYWSSCTINCWKVKNSSNFLILIDPDQMSCCASIIYDIFDLFGDFFSGILKMISCRIPNYFYYQRHWSPYACSCSLHICINRAALKNVFSSDAKEGLLRNLESSTNSTADNELWNINLI